MGQRLVIEIKDNDKVLANAYYHWSGYTGSAAHLINDIVDTIECLKSEEREFEPTEKAAYLLFCTGARFNRDELLRVSKREDVEKYFFAMSNNVNRNDGLLAITEEETKDNLEWAEAYASIDIDTGEIEFDVFWTEDADEYMRENNDITELPVFRVPENLNYNDNSWEQFYTQLTYHLNACHYVTTSSDRETVYFFIE